MAKRTPRSQADEAATGSPSAKPRPGRARGQAGAGGDDTVSQAPGAPQSDRALAARPEAGGHVVVAASVSSPASKKMVAEPSDDDIRLRAYHLYLARGRTHGRHYEDWLAAERELRRRRG